MIFRFFKKMSLIVLLGISLFLAFHEETERWAKTWDLALDVRAALLVFVTPILVLLLFKKESLSLVHFFRRLRQLLNQNNEKLTQSLQAQTQSLASQPGQYSYAQVTQWVEKQEDQFMKFAGDLFISRYTPQEMLQLLTIRAQAEDLQLQNLCSATSFLAKMAPFFGMLATVIGMIHLMQNMEDFSKISESMGLAMQGTLYGLISFTLIYAPIQKFLIGTREEFAQRNEIITRWFLLINQKSEAAYIQEEMRASLALSQSFSGINLGDTGTNNPNNPRSSQS